MRTEPAGGAGRLGVGTTTVGRRVLLAVEPGGDESHDAWASFLEDLTHRGLRPPLLVVSDGAAGLIGAIDTKTASALRQRCLIHRCRNVLAKVPAQRRDEPKAPFWAILELPEDTDPGAQAVRAAQAGIDAFARRYERELPAAVKCLLTAHLRFPAEHWRRIRHTNRPRSRFTAGGRGVGRIFRRLGSIVAQNHRKLREQGRTSPLAMASNCSRLIRSRLMKLCVVPVSNKPSTCSSRPSGAAATANRSGERTGVGASTRKAS